MPQSVQASRAPDLLFPRRAHQPSRPRRRALLEDCLAAIRHAPSSLTIVIFSTPWPARSSMSTARSRRPYTGNYSQFEQIAAALHSRRAMKQQGRSRTLRSSTASAPRQLRPQAQSRIKALERMERIAVRTSTARSSSAETTPYRRAAMVRLERVTLGYGDAATSCRCSPTSSGRPVRRPHRPPRPQRCRQRTLPEGDQGRAPARRATPRRT